ncbi:MAG TPA: DUF4396 domain-containing protein [Tepidisphaeraceae bacterium]|jgi:hypothetical protein
MIPYWLHILSIASLILAGACAVATVIDLFIHPQHMWVMNIVWPTISLFGGPISLWAYFTIGRLSTRAIVHTAKEHDQEPPNRLKPFWQIAGVAASHCGSGCALGDLCAEWLGVIAPGVAVWFGWHSLFKDKIFAMWIIDYIFAYAFGIAFQYFTIKPMRGLSVGQGLAQAIKADTLSLTSWQLGMYGFMAVAHFWLFGSLLQTTLRVNSAEFWFMMQIAMICGFLTSYPVNWWLLKVGIKERM